MVTDVRLPRGTIVVPQGAAPTDVVFPETCVLSMSVQTDDGRGCEVATIGNEGVGSNGLEAALGGVFVPAEVAASLAGEAYQMDAKMLRALVQRNEEARRVVNQFALGLVGQLIQSVACNRLHSLEQRLARRLLRISDHTSSSELPLTHEFLASMLSASRVSVTRTLDNLVREGLLQSPRASIRILDRPGLEARTCECYFVIRNRYQKLLLE